MNQSESGIEIIGEITTVQKNNETYQVQQVEFEGKLFFIVRNSYGILCMIMQNQKGEWEPDCEISEELFKQIEKFIRNFRNINILVIHNSQ
jgi:hypothetical protein